MQGCTVQLIQRQRLMPPNTVLLLIQITPLTGHLTIQISFSGVRPQCPKWFLWDHSSFNLMFYCVKVESRFEF